MCLLGAEFEDKLVLDLAEEGLGGDIILLQDVTVFDNATNGRDFVHNTTNTRDWVS